MKYKYFTREEINAVSFGVKNGFSFMDTAFMHMMDLLREVYGKPLVPTCAYRSEEWDISKGRSGNSDHCEGKAMDIYVETDADMLELVYHASLVGFNAFGYNKANKFLHIGKRDVRKVTTWNY